ncbi:MAG: hypothetical protein IPI11_07420 [Haliscomenobacter sp.]|nr:hypothetical protein [Haliscomenobacter sp.]
MKALQGGWRALMILSIFGLFRSASFGQTPGEPIPFQGLRFILGFEHIIYPPVHVLPFTGKNKEDQIHLRSLPLPENGAAHTDRVYDLTCQQPGFSGYFDPSRWMAKDLYGDAGVDVTGAPKAGLLVETSDNASMEVANDRMTTFRVLIPANGYAAFRWSVFGGSITPPPFRLLINSRALPIDPASGVVQTPYLRADDVLGFEWTGTDQEQASVVLSHFEFHSTAEWVLERSWTGSRGETIRQLVVQESPDFSLVRFPEPVTGLPAYLDPATTGYPYIDLDGNAATTNDVIAIDGTNLSLQVDWEDQYVAYQGKNGLLRKWMVVSPCSGNTMEGAQWIELGRIGPSRASGNTY